jgi:hypothetical protein
MAPNSAFVKRSTRRYQSTLNRDGLTKGQRLCIVLNLYEAKEQLKAKQRQSSGRNNQTSFCTNGHNESLMIQKQTNGKAETA